MRIPEPRYFTSFDTPTLFPSKSPTAVEPKSSYFFCYGFSSNIFNTSPPPGSINEIRLRATDNSVSGRKPMPIRLHFLDDHPTNHSNKEKMGIGRHATLLLQTKNLVQNAREDLTVALSKTLTKLMTRGRDLDD